MSLARGSIHRSRGERGLLLVTVAAMLVLVAGLSVALLESGLGDRRAQAHQETSLFALHIAEMALLRAETEIAGETDHDGDGLGVLSGAYGGGSFVVEATQDPVDPARWILTARGRHGHSQRMIEEHVRVRPGGLFFTGLFGRDSLDIRGYTQTDAFDSRLGTYASQAVNYDADYGEWYADASGDVGSNGAITIAETGGDIVKIRGDAIPGPLDVVTIAEGSPEVSGSTTPRAEEAEVPPPPIEDFQDAFASPDNAVFAGVSGYDATTRSLTLSSGDTLTLDEGTYFLRDLSVQSGAQITVTGPVKLYVTEGMDLRTSSVNNPGGKASDLLVLMHPYPLPAAAPPTGTFSTTINGGATCYMAVYAPELEVKFNGGGDFYGAIVAATVKFSGNARFHYDRALAEETANTGNRIERTAWVDRAVPRR